MKVNIAVTLTICWRRASQQKVKHAEGNISDFICV